MRLTFMIWLREKVFRVPEGVVGPKVLWYIYWILHPLQGFYANQSGVHYNPLTDIYTINGDEFSSQALKALSKCGVDASEAGEAFRKASFNFMIQSDEAYKQKAMEAYISGVPPEEAERIAKILAVPKKYHGKPDDATDADDIGDDE